MTRACCTNRRKPIVVSLPRVSALTILAPALLLVAVAGCSKQEPAPQTAVAVEAAPVQLATITEHVVADAVLSPVAEAAITPKITAPVKKYFVQRGSKVKAGELLATLDNSDLEAAVTDSKGSYDAARAAYQTAVQGQVPEDYQKAQLDLQQARANLDLNRSIVASRQKLFNEGAIAGRDLDTSKAALVQAQAAYDTAAKHLAAMKQFGREAELQSAKGTLESARGKYLGATAALSYSEIRSPIRGVVTDRPLYLGEMASPGSPLITVMDTSALIAKIHLSQPQAQMLSKGDPASVQVPGLPDPVPGKITLISPALDPGSTTVEVWVRLENPKGQLRPGTAVHVTVAGRTVPKAVAVPSQAIVLSSTGQPTVMVIGSDGVAHQVAVTTGIAGGGDTQILSGVSPGQQVVTVGAYALDDGTHVKVVTSLQDSDASGTAGSGDDK